MFNAISPPGELVLFRAQTLSTAQQAQVRTNITASKQIIEVHKTTSTSRNSTTTLADDPDLTYAIPVAGHYHVRAFLNHKSTSATPGAKFLMNYTGTRSLVSGSIQQVAGGTAGYVGPDYTGTDIIFTYSPNSVAQENAWIYDFSFNATTTGTLSVQWAQQVSNATDSTLVIGSWMRITPLF